MTQEVTPSDQPTISTASPSATIQAGDAASAGSAATLLRSDAQMAVSTATAATLTGSNAEGSATSLARSDHNHAFPAWASYTPTWATSGTGPSLGNGTLTGRWQQLGKTVHFRIKLTIGSTTTVGTGLWKFAAPATAAHSGYDPVGTAYVLDSGTDTYGGHAVMLETGNIWPTLPLETGALAPSRSVSNTHPVTPATGDTFGMSGTYEAA